MQRDHYLIELLVVAVLCAVAVGAVALASNYTCGKKAKFMGMRHDWAPFQGCMIEPKPGQWVPLNNYRVQ